MSETTPGEQEGTKDKIPAVAAVLSRNRVVINVGWEDGLDVDQRFLVYEVSDDIIRDPITDEELGFLEIPKGEGVVVHVQPRLATLYARGSGFSEPLVGDRIKQVY